MLRKTNVSFDWSRKPQSVHYKLMRIFVSTGSKHVLCSSLWFINCSINRFVIYVFVSPKIQLNIPSQLVISFSHHMIKSAHPQSNICRSFLNHIWPVSQLTKGYLPHELHKHMMKINPLHFTLYHLNPSIHVLDFFQKALSQSTQSFTGKACPFQQDTDMTWKPLDVCKQFIE